MKKYIYRFSIGMLIVHIVVVLGLVFAFSYPNPLKTFQSYSSPNLLYSHGIARQTPYWFFEKDNCEATIVISHGRSRNKAYMTPLIEAIWAKSNTCILAVDLPSHGERGFGRTTIGPKERTGIVDALWWLEQQKQTRVFLFGVSMGGSATLHFMAEENIEGVEILGVVVDGTYASLDLLLENVQTRYHVPSYIVAFSKIIIERLVGYTISEVRPEDISESIQVPLLVLHGDKDWLAPPISAKRIAASAPNALPFWYNGGHDTPENSDLQELVNSFCNIILENPTDWKSTFSSQNAERYRDINP